MNIYIDIDETICYYEGIRDYNLALPMKERIEKINKMFDEGHNITYYTARGVTTGIDWRAVTLAQLDKWGCRYHHLSMYEKPHYDLLICDKAINSEAFFKK